MVRKISVMVDEKTISRRKRLLMNEMKICFGILVVAMIVGQTTGLDQARAVKTDTCSQAMDCSGCFSAGPNCDWCADPSWGDGAKCFDSFSSTSTSSQCSGVQQNPMRQNVIPDTIDFGEHSSRFSATITPGNEIVLPKVIFRNTRDRPIDLYFLMDLTYSMLGDKRTVVRIGVEIAEALKNITSRYRIGFGSFGDKPLLPYVLPKYMDNMCEIFPPSSDVQKCERIYSYKNHLSLTDNINDFIRTIDEAELTAGLDNADGGFDALLQVAMCWVPKIDENLQTRAARKLVLYMTNIEVLPHFAGDGKMGGAVLPVDFKCHLADDGIYHNKGFDYPSIEELDYALRMRDITAIFATPSDPNHRRYEKLAGMMSSNPVSAVLEKDSANIVAIIQEAYTKLAQHVTLKATHDPMFKVHFNPACIDPRTNKTDSTSGCLKVGLNEDAVFSVSVSLDRCYNDTQFKNQKIIISPVGLTEDIEIDVTIECDCSCHREVVANATECTGQGDLRCGLCECRDMWVGERCECNSETSVTQDIDCMRNGAICSGHGRCICGKCECSRPFFGQFCDINENTCPRSDGSKPCGQHGQCTEEGCKCEPGWKGAACECRDESNSKCVEPGTSQICSGHGTCSCDGQCVCSKTSGGWYVGDYCEICPTCGGCGKYTPWVENYAICTDKRLSKSSTKCDKDKLQSTSVKVLQADTRTLKEYMKHHDMLNRRVCQTNIAVGNVVCYYEFVFIEQTQAQQNVTIIFQLTSAGCWEPLPVWRIAVPIIAAIVLFGLIMLLVWKLIVYLRDKHERKLFEAEQQRALDDIGKRADLNPLYKSPYSEFVMPDMLRSSAVDGAEDD